MANQAATVMAGPIAEVVEVKNTCPFRLQTRISRKGGTRQAFVVADRGPRDQVSVAPSVHSGKQSLQLCMTSLVWQLLKVAVDYL